VEDVGQGVGHLPALGQAGLQLEVLVAGEQAVKEQLIDALRLGVGADPRIEVRRAALDDHDQCVGVGAPGAGDQETGEQDDQRQKQSAMAGWRGQMQNAKFKMQKVTRKS